MKNGDSRRSLKKLDKMANEVERLEPKYKAMTDSERQSQTEVLKGRLKNGETLDDILYDAFAALREASSRVLGMRHFHVQIIGGICLFQGRIAEMKTGEGKTLVATLPAYLEALSGKGVHIVTVNDYLARRDAEWMGKVHRFMGLTVGVVVPGMDEIADVAEAKKFAGEIGYPVIVRPAFTLGGTGGGIARTEGELKEIAAGGLRLSPISQILVEKSVEGWKEIEFEVMRDKDGNAITVCSMENLDPVGIHTGDSIVVAPALTLADREYQMLRNAALHIISSLGVEGGCNVQFALNPECFAYAVIEVNPRVSRSSALASKATGYPIAKVAAKIAIGYTLDEIKNAITQKTYASFEPMLDYVVVKLPRLPFDKFISAKRTLTTQMKATGEVMSICNNFEGALMKAIRSLEKSRYGLGHVKDFAEKSKKELLIMLATPSSERHFIMYEALRKGASVEEIYNLTKVKTWFIQQMKELVEEEEALISKYQGRVPEEADLRQAKLDGFSDKYLSEILKVTEEEIRTAREGYGIVEGWEGVHVSSTKDSAYYYSSYHIKDESPVDDSRQKVMILGGGPNRIGQGIEFDYCCVHAAKALRKLGFSTIIVNCNPETVSTDYDTSDKLYFEPLTAEDVWNVLEVERPVGVVCQFGGQTAIKLCNYLDKKGVRILGTSADSVDMAEDRERFDELLERCGIPRAPGRTVFNLEEALAAADEIGLPVLMRPSYVLGGQNMIVAYTKADVIEYMGVITEHVDMDHPVLLDKYIQGTECEVDAICDGENFLIPGIMEQVERTGVHSGDSICVYPAQHLTQSVIDTMVDYTGRFARELKVVGLVNVQYAVSNNRVYVIEVNPRSSRTVPYISKVTGVPMVDLAVRCCLGEKLVDMGYGTGLHPNAPYVAVKVPVFSFEKLHGVDTQFGPEMKSTGEVLGIAPNYHDALLKGLIGAGYTFKTPGPGSCCIFTVKDSDKPEFVDIAWRLKNMGYKLYGTSGTCAWLNKHMVPCNEVRNMSGESPNIIDLLQSGLVDYVFSTSAKGRDPRRDSVRLRRKAVELSIPCITAVDTATALVNCLSSEHSLKNIPLVDIATLYRNK